MLIFVEMFIFSFCLFTNWKKPCVCITKFVLLILERVITESEKAFIKEKNLTEERDREELIRERQSEAHMKGKAV